MDSVQHLQAQLFPVSFVTQGFLGSFLSNNLKTNQVEVNTDLQTSRPIARLKEPRDLFALPKDNECSQQTARWPIECQVLDDRVSHINYVPANPEPFYEATGSELQPRPLGEENGVVVYNYNPISSMNYKSIDPNSDESDDDEDDDENVSSPSTNGSRSSSPESPDQKIPNDVIKLTATGDLIGSERIGIENLKITDDKSKTKPINEIEYQFSGSSVGGAKYLLNAHPTCNDIVYATKKSIIGSVVTGSVDSSVNNKYESTVNDLIFESRFECGNLAKAIKITSVFYELYLRPDLYTNRYTQWFYFRVTNTRKGVTYRLSIVNLVKCGSLYNEGMKPLMYSTIDANQSKTGWTRCGANISYFRNEDINSQPSNEEDDDNGSSTLSFNIQFPHDNDIVYFAHSYPYTYTDLQDYLMAIQSDKRKTKFCKLRLLCRSLAGNNVYALTVTAPSTDDEATKKKKAIVISARVHPGESPASWMMKGLMDYITSDALVAKKLRHKFIFKLVPMLNPDGVIVGNTRCSLTAKDLNRQYRTVIRETYPSIWYTKAMIKRLMDDCGVIMYCDMHAHSRKHNIFIYGCENRRCPEKKLTEQVFPLMLHKNVADRFSFENCKFRIQRNKEGTGRIVIWAMGITNSYTMEASFGGSTLGNRKATHFSTADYEQMGRAFCETLLDYVDENKSKVIKLKRRIRKYRKRERHLRKAAKLKKLLEEQKRFSDEIFTECLRMKIVKRLNEEGSNADLPLNITLSDYSSDDGETTSSDGCNEGKKDSTDSNADNSKSELRRTLKEGPCCQSNDSAPPPSPITIPIKPTKKTGESKPLKRKIELKSMENSGRPNSVRVVEMKYLDKFFVKKKNVGKRAGKHKRKAIVVKVTKQVIPKSAIRPVLDLPTTEPELELVANLNSSDEDSIERTIREKTGRSPTANRSFKSPKKMPPEIIVNGTADDFRPSPKKTSDRRRMVRKKTVITKNRSSSQTQIATTVEDNSGPMVRNEHARLKLRMKNYVWSGDIVPLSEEKGPLSWGIPTKFKRKSQRPYDADRINLLLSCSRKLIEWQEMEMSKKSIDIKKHRQRFDVSGTQQLLSKRPETTNHSKTNNGNGLSEFVNCFQRSNGRRTTGNVVDDSRTRQQPSKIDYRTMELFESRKQPGKFKTGGIVVTACTTRPATVRNLNVRRCSTSVPVAVKHRNNDVHKNLPYDPDGSNTDSFKIKSFVKKVKSKLKIKK